MKLTIIGGGIAGLAAAYYASKLENFPVEITILEQADYWGGKLVTDRVPYEDSQFIIEGGPDTFVVTKPWGVRLCKELGLSQRLRGTNPETKKTYILKNNTLHELPGGLTMMIPTEFGPMLRSGLLSWPAKARMGMDFFLPAAVDNGDETMGDFVTRRLGRAAYENLIEPLMSGIYAGDGDKLSLQSTLPYLRDLELKYGGLVKGALAVRKERVNKTRSQRADQQSKPKSSGIFLTPLTGLGEIVERLTEKLVDANVDMRLNTRVSRLQPDATTGSWNVELEKGEVLNSDAIILAAPAFASGEMIASFAPDLAAELSAIEYVSTATVTLAFQECDLLRPLDGYGYVIPRREMRRALACTWTSTKFPHRAPDGLALLRVFIGRAGQEGLIDWEDQSLLEIAYEELELTLGITARPLLSRVFKWEKAMPQYNLGHMERLNRITEALDTFPGLGLAGNAYRGIGIPDCINSGEAAVEKIMAPIRMSAEKEALKG